MTTDPWSSADTAPALARPLAAASMSSARIQSALTGLRIVTLPPSHEDRNTLLPQDGTLGTQICSTYPPTPSNRRGRPHPPSAPTAAPPFTPPPSPIPPRNP